MDSTSVLFYCWVIPQENPENSANCFFVRSKSLRCSVIVGNPNIRTFQGAFDVKKQILTAALLSLLTAGLTAAELTVAATPVPHGDILRLVAPDLKAQGYDLKVVEFSDFVSPNIALDAKEVTANYYQHKPF